LSRFHDKVFMLLFATSAMFSPFTP